jgi:hypothetical protein
MGLNEKQSYQAAIMIMSLFNKIGERNTSIRPSDLTNVELIVFSFVVLEFSVSFTTCIFFNQHKI